MNVDVSGSPSDSVVALGVDIGTTSVKVVVVQDGEHCPGFGKHTDCRTLGVASHPSQAGVEGGSVLHVEQDVDQIVAGELQPLTVAVITLTRTRLPGSSHTYYQGSPVRSSASGA